MIKVKLFFGFHILLLFVQYSASLKYVPPEREVEVIQASTYRIGVEDAIDEDITHCNFTSNTGLNCSFEVWPTRSNKPRETPYCATNGQIFLFENTVTEHGKEGLCQITVDKVQATGPSVWRLVAKNFDGDIVVNNTFTVHFFYMAPLLTTEIKVEEYSDFVNHMTGFAFDELKTCNVRFNDTLIELDLHSTRTNTFLTPYSEATQEVSERVKNLGVGLCGFKYINATNTIRHLKWTLTASDNEGRNYRQIFSTRIDPQTTPGNRHSRRVVLLGSKFDVACGSTPITTHLCVMYNSAGEYVPLKGCRYTITSFAMSDAGVWKCYAGNENAMESLEYTIELIPKTEETMQIWNYETDTYVSIGCKTINVSPSIMYCKMIAPDRRLFNLRPTLATERYLSLGTDVNSGVCSLQIKKPLQEFEKGRWLCEIGISYRNATGSPIIVGEGQEIPYVKHMKKTTQLGDSLTIHCEVPYFSEYCRIQAPNGTKYMSASQEEVRLGRCSFTIENVNITDNGTWICSYGRETGLPDDQILVEITIAEVLQYFKFVEVDSGDAVTLECHSGGLPLKYCRFISPSGVAYQIHNHKNSSTISYHGKGLEFGECGIRIANTKTTDNGYWTCVTEISSGSRIHGEVSARILVDVNRSLMDGANIAAIGIGTAVAVILVGSVFGMIGIRKWRRRRHDDVPGTSTAERGINTDDTISQTSETNIFSMGPAPRSYTNPQTDTNDGHEHQP